MLKLIYNNIYLIYMIKNIKEKVTILAPVSLGELIDKITILEIKKENFF